MGEEIQPQPQYYYYDTPSYGKPPKSPNLNGTSVLLVVLGLLALKIAFSWSSW